MECALSQNVLLLLLMVHFVTRMYYYYCYYVAASMLVTEFQDESLHDKIKALYSTITSDNSFVTSVEVLRKLSNASAKIDMIMAR